MMAFYFSHHLSSFFLSLQQTDLAFHLLFKCVFSMLISTLCLGRVSSHSRLWKVEVPCWGLKWIKLPPHTLTRNTAVSELPGKWCCRWGVSPQLPHLHTQGSGWPSNYFMPSFPLLTCMCVHACMWAHAHMCTSHMVQATDYSSMS